MRGRCLRSSWPGGALRLLTLASRCRLLVGRVLPLSCAHWLGSAASTPHLLLSRLLCCWFLGDAQGQAAVRVILPSPRRGWGRDIGSQSGPHVGPMWRLMRIKGTSRTCLGCVADKRNAFSSPGSLSAGCAWYAAPAPRFLCFVRRSFRPPCLIVCSSPCICYFVLCRFTVHCCRFGGPLVGLRWGLRRRRRLLCRVFSGARHRLVRRGSRLYCCAVLFCLFEDAFLLGWIRANRFIRFSPFFFPLRCFLPVAAGSSSLDVPSFSLLLLLFPFSLVI